MVSFLFWFRNVVNSVFLSNSVVQKSTREKTLISSIVSNKRICVIILWKLKNYWSSCGFTRYLSLESGTSSELWSTHELPKSPKGLEMSTASPDKTYFWSYKVCILPGNNDKTAKNRPPFCCFTNITLSIMYLFGPRSLIHWSIGKLSQDENPVKLKVA